VQGELIINLEILWIHRHKKNPPKSGGGCGTVNDIIYPGHLAIDRSCGLAYLCMLERVKRKGPEAITFGASVDYEGPQETKIKAGSIDTIDSDRFVHACMYYLYVSSISALSS